MKKAWLPMLVVMLLLGFMLSNSVIIFDDYSRLNGVGEPVKVRITHLKKDTRRDHDGYEYGPTRYRMYGEYSYNGKTYSNVFVGHSYLDDKVGMTNTMQIDPQKPWKRIPDSNGILLMILATGLFSVVSALGVQSFAENIMEAGESATWAERYRDALRKVMLVFAGLMLVLALVYSAICQTVTALIVFVIVQLAILLICKCAKRSEKKDAAKLAEQFRDKPEKELN